MNQHQPKQQEQASGLESAAELAVEAGSDILAGMAKSAIAAGDAAMGAATCAAELAVTTVMGAVDCATAVGEGVATVIGALLS